MGFIGTKSLLALARVNRELRSSIHSNEWNINTRLQYFVRDPRALRSILGKHQGLISGSFALQFFERVYWPDADLDMFFDSESGWTEMTQFLLEKEGYERRPLDDKELSYRQWLGMPEFMIAQDYFQVWATSGAGTEHIISTAEAEGHANRPPSLFPLLPSHFTCHRCKSGLRRV